MHDLPILLTFVLGLVGALVFGYVAQRLKLPSIIGYMLAGVAVGPFTPGYVADSKAAEQFAEIGVILLMFGVGVKFHLQELIAVWRVALPGALFQFTITTLVTMGLGQLLGWNLAQGVVLGMAIAVASTVVMAMVLAEHRDLHAPVGHIAVGWTVVEDLLTVVALLVLPVIFGESTNALPVELAIAFGKMLALVVVVVALGRWVIPWVLLRIERTKRRELFTLAVLVLALGIAVGSAFVFGVSMALGAFLAGLAVGRSDFAARAALDAMPMRDAFAVLFFVSVGMLVDPRSLLLAPGVLFAVLAIVLFVKPLTAFAATRVLGVPVAVAIPVGAALAQVGEFSFILGTLARRLDILSEQAWNVLVVVSIASIASNPFMYSLARRLGRQRPQPLVRAPSGIERDPTRAILVGYGPVGRIVWRLLNETGFKVTVVDLNIEAVRELREAGHAALYGDVLRPGTLEEAGLEGAGKLILSVELDEAEEVIRMARAVNPELRIVVRCAHLAKAATLRKAGADVIAAGEAEVGVALLEAMGEASPEQRLAAREQLYARAR